MFSLYLQSAGISLWKGCFLAAFLRKWRTLDVDPVKRNEYKTLWKGDLIMEKCHPPKPLVPWEHEGDFLVYFSGVVSLVCLLSVLKWEGLCNNIATQIKNSGPHEGGSGTTSPDKYKILGHMKVVQWRKKKRRDEFPGWGLQQSRPSSSVLCEPSSGTGVWRKVGDGWLLGLLNVLPET